MNAPFKLDKSTLGQREKNTPGSFRESQGMPYLDSTPLDYGPGDKETKEERGKRVYEEAMERIRAQRRQSEARKKMPKKNSILPRITSGMGSSFTTHND